MKNILIALLLFLSPTLLLAFTFSDGDRMVTTTRLNVRTGPGTDYRIRNHLQEGEVVEIVSNEQYEWVRVKYDPNHKGNLSSTGFVSCDYLRPYVESHSQTSSKSGFDWSIGNIIWTLICWGFYIFIAAVILYWVCKILLYASFIVAGLLTLAFRYGSIPFFLLNAIQRILAKPWFLFLKYHNFSNDTAATLREVLPWVQIPLYIVLTPIRLINALFFNIVIHCSFEMFNYCLEVIFPTCSGEGEDDIVEWICWLPLRIVKYPLWHGSLTIIESVIWTVTDIFLPALTLYHGTSPEAADSIVASPERGGWRGGDVGIWRVGGGNYAGAGIYFAPARSTAYHYSAGSLIICRVTLGSTLDLGIAPYHIFRRCGYPNAFDVTRWGLENGYVTGEWWRDDRSWWEYCMYDWKNRYNFSWRIRPLCVIDLETSFIQRIPGGMSHWLFRKMVLDDISRSLS